MKIDQIFLVLVGQVIVVTTKNDLIFILQIFVGLKFAWLSYSSIKTWQCRRVKLSLWDSTYNKRWWWETKPFLNTDQFSLTQIDGHKQKHKTSCTYPPVKFEGYPFDMAAPGLSPITCGLSLSVKCLTSAPVNQFAGQTHVFFTWKFYCSHIGNQ